MRLATVILTAISLLLASAWVVIFTRPIQHALLAATPVAGEPLINRVQATDALLDYFAGRALAPSSQPLTTVNRPPSPQRGGGIEGEGATNPLTARELTHLADVRGLMLAGRAATLLALAVLLGLVATALRQGRVAKLTTALGVGAKANLMAIAASTLVGLLVFPLLFDAFHRVAFRNDLWQLPPEAILLRRYPQAYFAANAAAIVGLDLLLAAALNVGLLAMLWRSKKTTT